MNLLKLKNFINISKIFRRNFSNSNNLVNVNSKIFLNDKYSQFSFDSINQLSNKLSKDLLNSLNRNDLNGEKIAVLCSNNYTYLISILAIWKSNGVPLGINKSYPNNLIEYFINDSKCKLVINGINESEVNNNELDQLIFNYNVINYKLDESNFFQINNLNEQNEHDSLEKIRNLLNLEESKPKQGIILYTSGTSGPPKGVVLTRLNILRTIETLINSWNITPNDSLLHTLPLNHVHGLIYCLLTYLYSGCHVHMLSKFNPETVWSLLLDEKNSINSFMAVPTIYVQLVNHYFNNKNDFTQKNYDQEYIKHIFKTKMRLIVSGSAPLNVKTYKEWNEITGYRILERYGMTEIGLGLSNPFKEDKSVKRIPGAVGRPYGNTRVRIVGEDEQKVLIESGPKDDTIYDNNKESIFGELQIKGDMVFKEYLNKPLQTKDTFTEDGWFKTGDTAEFLKDSKAYKLIGRTSVDVIKSGGYKISALDIEKELLAHDQIDDVAVMGLSDLIWGQKVFALLVLKPNINKKEFDYDNFKNWCKLRLPKQSVPKLVKIIDKMPRNQLGKVNKKELIKLYEAEFKNK